MDSMLENIQIKDQIKDSGNISENFLHSVLNGIDESIKIIDRDFNVLFANKKCQEIAEVRLPDLGGHKCHERYFEECSFCVAKDVFQTGRTIHHSGTINNNGQSRTIEISLFPLRDEVGKVQYAIEIVRDVTELLREVEQQKEFGNMISQDPKMLEIFDLIQTVSKTDSTVLIRGETGTGKELVARAIHENSYRKNNKFVVINCGALTDTLLEAELFGHERGAFTGAERRRIGKFELANEGTLFLDEIGNISEAMQIKILRVLQDGGLSRLGSNDMIYVNVRIICATNRDLEKAVKEEKFRSDLYYRINVVPIVLPPLRERKGDVRHLSNHVLCEYSEKIGKHTTGFSPSVIQKMENYSWPGNIRELRNLVERAVILAQSEEIVSIDIPEGQFETEQTLDTTLKEVVNETERVYLERLLSKFKGNITETAKHSDVDTRTIHRKLKEYGIKKELFKS